MNKQWGIRITKLKVFIVQPVRSGNSVSIVDTCESMVVMSLTILHEKQLPLRISKIYEIFYLFPQH